MKTEDDEKNVAYPSLSPLPLHYDSSHVRIWLHYAKIFHSCPIPSLFHFISHFFPFPQSFFPFLAFNIVPFLHYDVLFKQTRIQLPREF
jgi:hypothetical protein